MAVPRVQKNKHFRGSNPWKLTKLEYDFCHEYILTREGLAAMEKAGYKGATTPTHLLNRPKVKNYLYHLMKPLEDKAIWTAQEKIKQLKYIADGCVEGKADKEGLMSPQPAIAAIAEANKMQGHYAPAETKTTHALDPQQFKDMCKQYEQPY